jgi:hypothetical protein
VKALVILSFELPDGGEAFLTDILEKMDPAGLPFFAGVARVTVDPLAGQVEEWLDEE